MSKSTEQTEHLKEMLVGNILTVSWPEVEKTALLYGAIGLFHYIFRRKFLTISMDPHKAEAEGISVRLWDFLFYASFGFVVTSAIAGVLLVFCYLIVPSVGAMLFAQRISSWQYAERDPARSGRLCWSGFKRRCSDGYDPGSARRGFVWPQQPTGDLLAYKHTAQVIGGVDGEVIPLEVTTLAACF